MALEMYKKALEFYVTVRVPLLRQILKRCQKVMQLTHKPHMLLETCMDVFTHVASRLQSFDVFYNWARFMDAHEEVLGKTCTIFALQKAASLITEFCLPSVLQKFYTFYADTLKRSGSKNEVLQKQLLEKAAGIKIEK